MSTRFSIERGALPEVTDARIARQWAGTQARIARMARARWQRPGLAAALAACAVLLVVSLRARSPGAVTVGALLESGGPQTFTLGDGSRVDLAASSRMHVGALEPSRIELALEQGSAVFDVRHVAGRRFAVQVGAFDVIDVGTRFQIALGEGGAVSVSVEVGSLRIERRGSAEPARYLSAGERWSSGAAEPEKVAPPAPTGSAMDPAATASSIPEPAPTGPTAHPSPPSPSSKDVLDAAQRAQREGRLQDAAAAYDRLRREFRGDARAGLAAFELGRLRLGPLADPRGAAKAFQDAIDLSPGAPFREDAEADLVEAFDAAGDARRCDAARRAYLAHYPKGLHATGMTSRCSSSP